MALNEVLQVIPLVVILLMAMGLRGKRAQVQIAGFAGALLAIIFGWLFLNKPLTIPKITSVFVGGITGILGIASVIIYASTAMFVATAGGTKAFVELIQRIFKKRIEVVVGLMVFTQAAAVYMAGCGAANTLITAPLIYSTVGWIPGVVAGLSIVSPTSWTTSPSSAESAVTAKIAGIEVPVYAEMMRPFTFFMWAVGIAIAIYSTRRAVQRGLIKPGAMEAQASPSAQQNPGQEASAAVGEKSLSMMVVRAFPFIFFLIMIVLGPAINQITGQTIFTIVSTPFLVVIATALCLKVHPNKIGEWLIEGGRTILWYLFYAGFFLGFINVIAEIGTFTTLANLVRTVPVQVVVVAAIIIGFAVGVPAGAYTVMVMSLILPVLKEAGIPIWAFGFVNYGIAYGAMISPVQINVAATAHGFRTEIPKVIRNNAPYMPIALVIAIALSIIAGGMR
ncbi:MAG: hypothetical protein QXL35_02310 [Candidatus Bathyarchaeia archaeon]